MACACQVKDRHPVYLLQQKETIKTHKFTAYHTGRNKMAHSRGNKRRRVGPLLNSRPQSEQESPMEDWYDDDQVSLISGGGSAFGTSEGDGLVMAAKERTLLANSVANETCRAGAHAPEIHQATLDYLSTIARNQMFKISKWQKKEDFAKGGRFYNIAADMLDYRRTNHMEKFDNLWSAKSGFAYFVRKKLGEKRSSVDESLRNALGGE